MRTICYLPVFLILFIACKENNTIQTPISKTLQDVAFEGNWDNFQQYWLENTETTIHRMETDDNHRHFSIKIKTTENDTFLLELREGRNAEHFVATKKLTKTDLSGPDFKIDGDTLYVKGDSHFKNKDPYRFVRTRKFSGWIEVPLPQYKDSIFRKSNLEIHDQGGMAELQIDGIEYTVELTQLLFGQKLPIMKLAIYDMPLDSVQINSRSISYAWLNPKAKRTGINLRKVVSGWTLVEPGYINSDNTDFKKK